MKVFKLLYVLYKIQLLSPVSLYRFIIALFKSGINLMTPLYIAEKKYADHIALVDDDETLSYKQLLEQSNKLASCLKKYVHLQRGQKVAFLCKNHASLVKSVFAVSRLGADLYLLNTEMSSTQFNELVQRHNFDLIIYDEELRFFIEQSNYSNAAVLSYHEQLPAVNNFFQMDIDCSDLPRVSAGRIVLQTSGTTGKSKDAAHKPSLFNYLNPFVAFIQRLKIIDYHTAYIATPIYHGYGIAVLLLFMPLGKKVVISQGFNAEEACNLIKEHHVEVVTVVPLMLQKMMQTNVKALQSLACIASGGARLSTKIVEETQKELGNVLYNLYGTSESGLNFIATPQDLQYDAATMGKGIQGMRIKVVDGAEKQVERGMVGHLCIQNAWSIRNRKSSWIQTGDLAYQDEKGYYFLCGRIDDMVISGGENVYPIEIEQVLIKHPLVEDVAIIGVSDHDFGERLKAFVVPTKGAQLTEEELRNWLRTRVARYQMPRDIEFINEMPYTPIGKIDKKRLKEGECFDFLS